MDAKSEYVSIQPDDNKIELTVNIQDGCRAPFYRFFASWTYFKSYNVTVCLLAMISVQFNNTKRWLDILRLLSMSDRRTGRRKQVKLLN